MQQISVHRHWILIRITLYRSRIFNDWVVQFDIIVLFTKSKPLKHDHAKLFAMLFTSNFYFLLLPVTNSWLLTGYGMWLVTWIRAKGIQVSTAIEVIFTEQHFKFC